MNVRQISRLFTGLALGCGAYVAFLLTQYFSAAGLPRFRIESFFMWFVALGVAAICLRATDDAVGKPDVDRELHPAHLKWLFVIFAAVAIVEYRAALSVGFLSDDFVLATWAANRELVHASATGFVRPVVPFVWTILSALPGSIPRNVHIANILLHALNATLVTALAARLGARRIEAVAAGIIFLTFPAMSEAIVWASGMQDVLMTTFTLAAILAVMDAEFSAGATVAAVGGFIVAVLTKETAVATPILAWLAAWVLPQGIANRRRRLALIVLTAAAIAYGIVRLLFGMPAGYGEGVSRYFAKQLIVDPLASLGAPWSAAWIESHRWSSLGRALVIVALMAVGIAMWRRQSFKRPVVFALWVLIAVLPVFSLFHVNATLEGSRYLYLPAVGFSLLLAMLAQSAAAMRTTAPAFASAAIVAAFVVPAFLSVPSEVMRWTAAAKLRDQILIAYIRVLPEAPCGSVVTEGAADSIDGAYVLRNGFLQAVAEMGADIAPSGASAPQCTIDWSDHLIVKQN